MKTITITTPDSSALDQLDFTSTEVDVTFKGGRKYTYALSIAAEDAAKQLREADSVGRQFNHMVKAGIFVPV
jgi:hypothetical protein